MLYLSQECVQDCPLPDRPIPSHRNAQIPELEGDAKKDGISAGRGGTASPSATGYYGREAGSDSVRPTFSHKVAQFGTIYDRNEEKVVLRRVDLILGKAQEQEAHSIPIFVNMIHNLQKRFPEFRATDSEGREVMYHSVSDTHKFHIGFLRLCTCYFRSERTA